MKRKGFILLEFIIVYILISLFLIISFCTKKEELEFKEYKKLDEVTLKDGSKWVVLNDSDSKTNYVTLFASREWYDDITYDEDNEINKIYNNYYEDIADEYYSGGVKYLDSSIVDYLNEIKPLIPVKYKSIDGYKIRLIKIEDIINIDSSWEYNEEYDTYTYFGNDSKLTISLDGDRQIYNGTTFGRYFKTGYMLMDETMCGGGKCASFYSLIAAGCGYEDKECENTYMLSTWNSGVPFIRPVINILKSSI